MADDRPVEDQDSDIAQLRRDLEDLKSTALARASRCTTGTVEAGLIVKPGTLPLQGQTVSRATYPVLWKWVSDNSAALIVAGGFTVGDGSTTFGLPDFRNQALVVAGTLAVFGKVGADTKVLSTANLPAHKHSVTVDDHDQHNHGFLTAQGGNHGGHFPGTQVNVQSGGSFGVSAWNSVGADSNTHNHSGTTAYGPVSSHVVGETSIGSGTAVDVRQASMAVQLLIWT